MATTLPVMKGRIGSVDYYLTTVKAAEAVTKIRAASELPSWNGLSIEERMQRELNWSRIEDEIGRFLATDPDRFFGALLVAVYHDGGLSFEPLAEMKSLPKLYANAAQTFGFLHLQGGEVLFALDGQHRLKGTEVAISGRRHDGEPIDDYERNLGVANDDIAIMLIPFKPEGRARKLFNKVNKYAKPTTKGDNIITSEDDTYALVARRIMSNKIISEKLVNWSSNTLTERMIKFTTVSVLYESAKAIIGKVDTQFRPDEKTLDRHYRSVKQVWDALLHDFDIFKMAMSGPEGDLPKLRKQYLCMKPAGQLAVIQAVAIARAHKMDLDAIVRGLNALPWDATDQLWQNVMMLADRVQAGRQAVHLTGRFIAHLIGTRLSTEDQSQLLRDYQKVMGDNPDAPKRVKTLPDPMISGSKSRRTKVES